MLDATTRAALEPVVRLFDALGVDDYIGGSLASIAYGEPRTTMDVDIVAALEESHAESIVSELGTGFHDTTETLTPGALRWQRSARPRRRSDGDRAWSPGAPRPQACR